jgi:VRR-NUC domain
MRKRIEEEVIKGLKSLHASTPKYAFSEESQADIINKYAVDVVALKGTYVANPVSRTAIILDGDGQCSVEHYASRHFRTLGYNTVFVESVPFHVLFGVYMRPAIQDPADSHNRVISFGDRDAFDAGISGKMISTQLPDDFGTQGYARRRANVIKEHMSHVMCKPGELQRVFDQWLGPSEGLRQYLWAHRHEQIQVARQLLNILPVASIIEILRYLVEDYWGRYVGWPDLLVYQRSEFFFAEVKSSTDKLGERQKNWIRDNYQRLHFLSSWSKSTKRLR